MINAFIRALRTTAVVSLIASAAWAQHAQPTIKLPSELDRVLRDYEKAWMAGNAAALTRLFAADGFVMQNSKAMYRGTAAIQQAYSNGAGGPLALRPVAYSTSDTLGYIIGAYAMKAGDADVGKFILLLSRTRGGPWLIAADMDNAIARR